MFLVGNSNGVFNQTELNCSPRKRVSYFVNGHVFNHSLLLSSTILRRWILHHLKQHVFREKEECRTFLSAPSKISRVLKPNIFKKFKIQNRILSFCKNCKGSSCQPRSPSFWPSIDCIFESPKYLTFNLDSPINLLY